MTTVFADRHLGPRAEEISAMLATLGVGSLEELVDKIVPDAIRMRRPLDLPPAASEVDTLAALRQIAGQNSVRRSYLGMGYHGTYTPGVILRNILENPGWYTAYTPYQAEIAQGRLEALLLFQMMVQDLTGFDVSNASLLDEATAAAEAMAMCKRIAKKNTSNAFFVADDNHPQVIEVVRTRAEALGWDVIVGSVGSFDPIARPVFGALVAFPATDGTLRDYRGFAATAHASDCPVVVDTDLLSLTLFPESKSWGADIAVGSTQRFGVPLGFGGPHAAFLACRSDEARKMPGRIIGVSRDASGKPAYRMSLGTREQHIRRAKATSNVCTAQVLLAVCAAMYAVWHGPEGLTDIARRIHGHTSALVAGVIASGFRVNQDLWFDTVRIEAGSRAATVIAAASKMGIDLRDFGDGSIGVAFDETVTDKDVDAVLSAFGAKRVATEAPSIPLEARRSTPFLTHPTFRKYRSETEMLRYLHRLESKDLSLNASMIPLGSCTMKLNATTEMASITWPEFGAIHPFVNPEFAAGYTVMNTELEKWLAEITGFAAISLQPNAGSQGEYAGLLAIRAYHRSRGDTHRTTCLIPTSAHGTNPASAAMAGFEIIEVACDSNGNVDLVDLHAKAEQHATTLGALMVTYPSTHGVFEEGIKDICDTIHRCGGMVYMDGANLNAMVGICRPGDIGADVCHLNLHKTFCIPHGGGGPGMGPIGVAKHLAPFLPGHPVIKCGGDQAIGPVSAAPYGSPSILPISWSYIRMMGADGLREATSIALLNANYVAKRLEGHYEVLYTGRNGFVAHECILDARGFKETSGVSVDDIAKRLMDYGFHGPTMSFPVSGTLMVEPTESEGKAELDRFCDAMIAIRKEIHAIEEGFMDRTDNPLHHAPHTAGAVIADDWNHLYKRELAAYPSKHQRAFKFWPSVARVDGVFGDKHLVTVLPVDEA